jgi:hypothetical protein
MPYTLQIVSLTSQRPDHPLGWTTTSLAEISKVPPLAASVTSARLLRM